MIIRFDEIDRAPADTLTIESVAVLNGDIRRNGHAASGQVATVAGLGLGVSDGALDRVLRFPAGSSFPESVSAESLTIQVANGWIRSISVQAAIDGDPAVTFVPVGTLFSSVDGSIDPVSKVTPVQPGSAVIANEFDHDSVEIRIADEDGDALGIPAYREAEGTPEATYKVRISIVAIEITPKGGPESATT